ncbi:MAG: hypothetical protein JW947_07850 [Sedimentisphaerales bacterium]|nr:hypothetical protein [Sedimentisphaerales bacterium]
MAFNNYLKVFIIYFSTCPERSRRVFSLFSLKQMRRLYVYEGNFNHFQTKLCETKPNSEMPKFNLSSYMINRCAHNLELLTIVKQSQTEPKQPQKFTRRSVSEGGQSQTNPTCNTCPAGYEGLIP